MQLEKGEPHRARGMPVFDEHVDATSECSVEQHVVDEVTDIDSRDDEGEPEVEDEDTRHLNHPGPEGHPERDTKRRWDRCESVEAGEVPKHPS